jgi:hypothetical protein
LRDCSPVLPVARSVQGRARAARPAAPFAQLHPLVPPQVLHFRQVPFLTSV